jgi:hypothetical protein
VHWMVSERETVVELPWRCGAPVARETKNGAVSSHRQLVGTPLVGTSRAGGMYHLCAATAPLMGRRTCWLPRYSYFPPCFNARCWVMVLRTLGGALG